MLALITSVLDLVGMVEGFIAQNPKLGSGIISALETLLPIAATEGQDALAAIKRVLASLQGSGNLTSDDLAALAALDAQCDAAFDAAANDAGV